MDEHVPQNGDAVLLCDSFGFMLFILLLLLLLITPSDFSYLYYKFTKDCADLGIMFIKTAPLVYSVFPRGQLALKFSDLVASTSILVAKHFRPFRPYNISTKERLP